MGDERGQAAAELAVLAPVLVALLVLFVAGARLVETRGQLDGAARSAARAASLAPDADAAPGAARRAALASAGSVCPALVVRTDLARWAPPGQAGSVAVELSCTVDLADAAVAGLPGSLTLRARSTAVLDTFRSAR